MGNRGDDPVETDLRAIARRRNGVTLQHWLALATAITIGAATVLGAVALRAPAAAFPAILAAAATVSVGAWVYAGHRIRSAWLTWQDAAALADHLAALDGRLSTWAGDPQRVAASRLGALLREQILRARPRWNASAIIPHRLSRALLLIPAMLVISGASMFLARPAHRPALSFPTAMTDGAAQAFVKHSQTGQRDGATTAGAEMHGQAGASGSAGTARTGDAQTLPGSDAGPHGSGEGQPSGDGAAPPHAAERLRDAIRAAFGADPAPGEQAKGSRGSQDPTRPGAVTLAKDSGGTGREPAVDAHARRPGDARQRRAPDRGSEHADPGKPGTGGRGGAARGGSGLFEENGTPATGEASETETRLRLGAIAAMAPSHSEPQRAGDYTDNATGAAPSTGAAPVLANGQLADAPLHRPEVGPHYESIVRRVFARP